MLALLLAVVNCSCAFAVMSIKGGFDNKKVGEAYTVYLGNHAEVEGRDWYLNYEWDVVEGSLPNGVDIFGPNNECWLKGTPTEPGTFTFTLRCTCMEPDGETAAKTFSVTILENSEIINPEIYGSFPEAALNVPYSESISAGNGHAPYTWSYTGTIPDNMNLRGDGNKYILSGTPKAKGTYTFTVKVTDSYEHSSSKTLTFTVNNGGSTGDNTGGNTGDNTDNNNPNVNNPDGNNYSNNDNPNGNNNPGGNNSNSNNNSGGGGGGGCQAAGGIFSLIIALAGVFLVHARKEEM